VDARQKKVAAAGVVVIFIAVAFILYKQGYGRGMGLLEEETASTPAGQNIAEHGDIATVNYVGMYPNGTVFDTSYKDVAEEAGVYNPLRTYNPITFTIGSGGLLKAFEEAVVGMKIGEEKTITLPPENAYGYPSKQLIVTEPKRQVSDRIQNVSRERFVTDIGLEPEVGLVFNISNETGYVMTWPMTVVNVTEDTVYVRHDPAENTSFTTVFGPAQVSATEDELIIYVDANPGQIVTLQGPALVTVDEENYTVDFNHELAGKTVLFKMKLEMLIKQ
jgi:FKBP-type peptidyl-prolyl cis-trans isomerase 2